MTKVNALSLRQSLGKVLRSLSKGGGPIYVEKNNKPVAVLISLTDFQERFADLEALHERERLIDEIIEFRRRHPARSTSTLDVLRDLRVKE